jgi:O-antigen/teichoic acid export membrane protein
LSRASLWNLSLNLANKSQTLALLAAGTVIGGVTGIGVIVTAMASALVGHALADFGLSGELTRLSVAFPNRVTVDRCLRALARQAPLALLLGPLIYVILGPTSGSVALLTVIGLNSAFLVGSIGLGAVLNGLGDFHSPATFLGGARLLSSIAAVAGAAIEPTPAVVIGCFTAAEGVGLVALLRSVRRARARLPEEGHPEGRVLRARLWFGVAQITNLLTNQADTLLVASILSPTALGLFATASTLENAAATLAFAPAMPVALRSVGTTLGGDRAGGTHLLRRAFITAAAAAVVLAVLVGGFSQLTGDSIGKLEDFASGDGPLVLALCVAAAPIGVIADLCVVVGAGFGRHRPLGISQIQAGSVAVAAIIAGAHFAGAVGAAGGTIVRDAVRVLIGRRLTAPPVQTGQLPDPEPAGPSSLTGAAP